MVEKMNGLSIDLISHPGETLKEVLEHEDMTQKELSIRTGLDKKTINQIINGVAPITYETAVKLEKIFKLKASFWNSLQATYNELIIRIKEIESISENELAILENIPYKELMLAGYVKKTNDKNNIVIQLRQFFRINDLNKIMDVYNLNAKYRKSLIKDNPFSIAAWLRICELETTVVANKFNKKLLVSRLEEIKRLNLEDINFAIFKLKEIFQECGVSFNVVINLKGAPIQGVIFNFQNTIRLCLTLRQKNADVFWFSLFHEIGHLLDLKGNSMIVDYINKEDEDKVDMFSSNILIDEQEYSNFIKSKITRDRIVDFAKKNGVLPCIIVGRLQHDKVIPYSYFNDLKIKYDWKKA